jgi:hypothetical protein
MDGMITIITKKIISWGTCADFSVFVTIELSMPCPKPIGMLKETVLRVASIELGWNSTYSTML